MKPLNRKERNNALYKVVGLFLISFVIAIFLAFTTLNVPKLSDNNLNSELKKLKDHLKFQEEVFAPSIDSAASWISKIPVPNENISILNAKIGNVLALKEIPKTVPWETQMYNNIINGFSNLQQAYNEQIILKNQSEGSKDLQEKLEKSEEKKEELEDEIKSLKAGAGGGSTDASKLQTELDKMEEVLEGCRMDEAALRKENKDQATKIKTLTLEKNALLEQLIKTQK